MERCLSLVLDTEAKISLILEKMEARELDEYILENFTSSEDVRQKYSKQIDAYLTEYKDFIEEVEESNGKRCAGRIVITERQDDLSVNPIKVLYLKDIIIFKEVIRNRAFMLKIEKKDFEHKDLQDYRRIFSDYHGKGLYFKSERASQFNRIVNSWYAQVKSFNSCYEIIRRVLKIYKKISKDEGFDSPDVVYSKYLKEQYTSRKIKKLKEEFGLLEKFQDDDELEQYLLMNEYNHMEDVNSHESEEPTRYKTYADEDGYPGDLEDSYPREYYSNLDELIDKGAIAPEKRKLLRIKRINDNKKEL